MKTTKENIIQKLDEIEFVYDEADTLSMYDLVDEIQEYEKPREIVPIIFEWFEKHYDKDLGTPGPFVHFIEESVDYHENLKESVLRFPTNHTVWMVNRLINGSKNEEEKMKWLELLHHVSKNANANSLAKEAADGFIDYQNS